MTMVSRSIRISPSSTNWPSSLFTLWRVAPIIDARSPCVYDPSSRIVPSASGPRTAGEPEETGRHPAGHVEEMELLDVVGQAAELAGQGRQECVAGARLRVDQLTESIARQDQRLGRLEGDRGRRARRAVEQGELAEEGTRPDRRQDRLVAPPRTAGGS